MLVKSLRAKIIIFTISLFYLLMLRSQQLRCYKSPISSFLRISSLPAVFKSTTPLLLVPKKSLSTCSLQFKSSQSQNYTNHKFRVINNAKKLHKTRLLALAAAALALANSHRLALLDTAALSKQEIDDMQYAAAHTHHYLQGPGFFGKCRRLLISAKRIVTLSLLFTPSIILSPIAYALDSAKLGRLFVDLNWEYNLWGIEYAGPTFIKLCQWAATRNDLFPPEFCDRFSRLQDATRGHSWKETESTLKER